MRPGWMFWAGFGAFVLDQGSKYLVVHAMELSRLRAIDVFSPLLNLRYGENTGINFGLFDGASDVMRWILVGFSLAVCAAVWLWARRSAATGPSRFGAGLLIGGALGNVADRLLYGYVLDFLNMSCCGIDNPFVFNLGDVFIFAGAFALILADHGTERKNAP